ncbi:helix-turn-helix transcriptional regulator [Myroides sp. WP-1]|uniref:helix-turn-helix transcriptional regulator n=1 Tax=Myroides sp. WP-1 TaxID=2759944 RepID=UPI0015FD79A2|nr:helix-turn-helix transcriptional regulator [Myroides sp. WP-1]MBB1140932.1 helix-turn-helix transcriptional regulator [Myroides sp. WP-1]
MNWIVIFILGYVFLYWINRKKHCGSKKILTLSLCVFGLHGMVYLLRVYAGYLPSVHFISLLFLFLGNGCIYLLKLKRNRWLLHSVSVLFLVYLLFNQLVVSETTFELQVVNKPLFLSISILCFFYGCYGYFCLMNNLLHKILKQYVAFYIVVLFCVSLSFLMIYFDDTLFHNYIDQLFYIIHLSLLIGAFLFEVKSFTYGRYKEAFNHSVKREWTQQTHRLLGNVALDISLPQVEQRSSWGTRSIERIDLTHLTQEVSSPKVPEIRKTNEIRQMMTEQLIETRLFLNPSLNLEQLSGTLNLQKSELIRFFKESQSATFKQYLNRLRVEYAILLIQDNEENFTVEELSLLCGFNTRLSFYRAFVEIFGFAPSEIMS